jgi:hypothetical protein
MDDMRTQLLPRKRSGLLKASCTDLYTCKLDSLGHWYAARAHSSCCSQSEDDTPCICKLHSPLCWAGNHESNSCGSLRVQDSRAILHTHTACFRGCLAGSHLGTPGCTPLKPIRELLLSWEDTFNSKSYAVLIIQASSSTRAMTKGGTHLSKPATWKQLHGLLTKLHKHFWNRSPKFMVGLQTRFHLPACNVWLVIATVLKANVVIIWLLDKVLTAVTYSSNLKIEETCWPPWRLHGVTAQKAVALHVIIGLVQSEC